ncbi:hypothetical protein [Epilithonimonas hispanica]|uniref:hypothetical protein n=1 Tax=Epilithonimonas hispanica TaxID=358687 RepID=UPI001FE9D234|nr:hypothetical protein [Epilithonimonas hispanica]
MSHLKQSTQTDENTSKCTMGFEYNFFNKSYSSFCKIDNNQKQPDIMYYIKHLTDFFEKVTQDKILNPTHISLYIALFQLWNFNRFRNPISISRDEVMKISKISSKATYHKCIKELHARGYIDYQPSYNPFRGSHVVMFYFTDKPRQEVKKS